MKKKDKGKWAGIGIGMVAVTALYSVIIKEIGTMVLKNKMK